MLRDRNLDAFWGYLFATVPHITRPIPAALYVATHNAKGEWDLFASLLQVKKHHAAMLFGSLFQKWHDTNAEWASTKMPFSESPWVLGRRNSIGISIFRTSSWAKSCWVSTRTRNPHQEVALVIYREHRLGDHCGSNTASASCNFASRITPWRSTLPCWYPHTHVYSTYTHI